MLVVDRLAVKLLEEVEDHVRRDLAERLAQGGDLVPDAELDDLVSEPGETLAHVPLGADEVETLLVQIRGVLRRDQILVHQEQHAKLSTHSAIS